MKTIWKFDLAGSNIPLRVPKGAVPLGVAMQGDCPRIWMLVDSEAELEDRMFWVRGTGQPLDTNDAHEIKHIGTVLDGPFIWHVFECVLKVLVVDVR